MNRANRFLLSLALLFSISTIVSLSTRAMAQAQDKLPYRKETLLNVVRSKQYKTETIIKAVQIKGVDFQLTDEIAAEFRAAGAFPQLIDAIRQNYRPTVATGGDATYNRPASPNNNPPLSEREIITLLQNGVPSARVQQTVAQRGVDFALTSQTARSIAQAGGSNSLIAAIRNNKRTPTPTPTPVAPRQPTYEEIMARAIDKNTNTATALQLVQAAINLNPARPEAYQLMGRYELYVDKNFVEAERYMRAAIERGGDAVFRVYHDHSGNFSSFCQGSLYISKDKLTYEADDGIDSYETPLASIKEAKINGLVGSALGAFHIKVPGSKRGNYNFAPLTQNVAESRVIISFIQKPR